MSQVGWFGSFFLDLTTLPAEGLLAGPATLKAGSEGDLASSRFELSAQTHSELVLFIAPLAACDDQVVGGSRRSSLGWTNMPDPWNADQPICLWLSSGEASDWDLMRPPNIEQGTLCSHQNPSHWHVLRWTYRMVPSCWQIAPPCPDLLCIFAP